MNLSHSSKINRRQATSPSTKRKCPECKEVWNCWPSGRFRSHRINDIQCPASGYSPSEWRVAKPKIEKEARIAAEKAAIEEENKNSWWYKEGL